LFAYSNKKLDDDHVTSSKTVGFITYRYCVFIEYCQELKLNK
jgi:hypothetical protein